jgi:hypothetical protein
MKPDLHALLGMLGQKWPNDLPAPVEALDNFLLAKEQSEQTKDGVVPDFQDLARRVCAAREIA